MGGQASAGSRQRIPGASTKAGAKRSGLHLHLLTLCPGAPPPRVFCSRLPQALPTRALPTCGGMWSTRACQRTCRLSWMTPQLPSAMAPPCVECGRCWAMGAGVPSLSLQGCLGCGGWLNGSAMQHAGAARGSHHPPAMLCLPAPDALHPVAPARRLPELVRLGCAGRTSGTGGTANGSAWVLADHLCGLVPRSVPVSRWLVAVGGWAGGGVGVSGSRRCCDAPSACHHPARQF